MFIEHGPSELADWCPLGLRRPIKSLGRPLLSGKSPNSCLGLTSPYLARKGQKGGWSLEAAGPYVGIDVSKDQMEIQAISKTEPI
jgi:hypothetical protein